MGRIRLRGQFFLYNQIRLMVGTAAAVCAGIISEELVTFALRLRTEMHMPMAPATGLFLHSSGFSMLDPRAGFAAMDEEQASLAMLPSTGIILVRSEGAEHAKVFVDTIGREIAELWKARGEAASWRERMTQVKPLSDVSLEDLRRRFVATSEREASERQQQAEGDRRRRLEALGYGRDGNQVLPRRFTMDMTSRFGLFPGWRTQALTRALGRRLLQWHEHEADRPPCFGKIWPPETPELLEYMEQHGIETLSHEGAD